MSERETRALFEILRPQRLTAVADVGSNPIDGTPPYASMLAAGLCTVVGFEPQLQALAALNKRKGRNETYLPHAIGDGTDATLYVTAANGMTSLFEPDPAMLALFSDFALFGNVVRRDPIRTRRLDDIAEIPAIDFLKIDIQGGELAAIQSGARKLAGAVAIQTEVSFMTLYKDQPAFGAIDTRLRSMGFVPHRLVGTKVWPLAPFRSTKAQQLLEADVLYVRDFSRLENMTGEQWKHLALIAHHSYRSHDLAMLAVRNVAKLCDGLQDAPARYVESLQPAKPGKRK